ncbi:hypothetical protein HK096_005247 [Nowakowskiella sp. JEL0078]|nr:hypothetical protein HK096_005247 [Nowakowskiella sp. JEL0078]
MSQTRSFISYQDFIGFRPNSVVVELLVLRDLFSPQLNWSRDVFILLPNGYRDNISKRFPVIYMHDSQNLFDSHSSISGYNWHIDKTMNNLFPYHEFIIVCLPNSNNDERWKEYGPFTQNSLADAYLGYIVDTVKPMVDESFRTQPDRMNTGIVGSSMGGLISIYAFFKHNDVFGNVGALSPSLWYGNGRIFEYANSCCDNGQGGAKGRVYLDVGNKEHMGMQYVARAMKDLLISKGFSKVEVGKNLVEYCELGQTGDENERFIMYQEDHMGTHSELAWAHRFPDVVKYFTRK